MSVQVVMRWMAVLGLTLTGFAGTVSASENGTWVPYTSQPVLEIWKGERRMVLRDGETELRRFPVVLGRAPRYPKEVRGDLRTPVGRYHISEKHVSKYHRFLGINYPNVDDAERGYGQGLIDPTQWADIFFANWRGAMPPAHTRLGGKVGIHGFGGRPYVPIDWTEGCIAVSNEDIEYIYAVAPVGTPVYIHE
jgi:murein L,D-transpeptidase YafK